MSVIASDARLYAEEWIQNHGSLMNGYMGSYLTGSVSRLNGGEKVPLGSDVDINLVHTDDYYGSKVGKFAYKGVILDVTNIRESQLFPTESALSSYHLAGGLNTDNIVHDPTGRLRALQEKVEECFYRKEWVEHRCESAKDKIVKGLESLSEVSGIADQTAQWLFPIGVTTHLLLVAGLRNPTVRLRYLRVREMLAEFDMMAEYEPLLELVRFQHLNPP